MRRILRALAILALMAPAAAEAAVRAWTDGGDTQYYEVIFYSDLVPAGGEGWLAAQAAAVARGGYLASVTSAAEQSFIVTDLFGPYRTPAGDTDHPYHGAYWIGLRDSTPTIANDDTNYAWVSGETYAYNNFTGTQPDDNDGFAAMFAGTGATEDYVHMVWRTLNDVRYAGFWNDAPQQGYTGMPAMHSSFGDLRHLNRLGFIVEYDENPISSPPPLAVMVTGLVVLASARAFSRRLHRQEGTCGGT